jgi:hypothetical protein
LKIDHAFHNFEHAAHVTMSVAKLFGRIASPHQTEQPMVMFNSDKIIESEIHHHTYGLTLDPLTQFGCIFAALIHDVDHPGVPNLQLIKEQSPLATKYQGKAIAEQNSVDIGWSLFMKPEYSTLRAYVCPTMAEERVLRQIVVNSVMATDIMDREVMIERSAKWTNMFSTNNTSVRSGGNNDALRIEMYHKGTMVLEHLIQASDVSHTMQHWHVYRKWNEFIFEEVYVAYCDGRGSDQDPSEFWYDGEINFFEKYIIPLATKLQQCGSFGVSGDEFLSYALSNLEEWKQRGEDAVVGMVERVKQKYLSSN